MKSLKIFIAVMSIVIFIAACQDKVAISPPKAGSVADFPNSVGLQFRYSVIDNLQPPIDSNKPFLVIDTIDQIITGEASSPLTGLATVWTQERNHVPYKEKLVQIRGDTVYFVWNFDVDSGFVDRIGLVFPFELGDSWVTGGVFSGDRTKVKDTTSSNTPIGYFKDVFILENTRRTFTDDSRTMEIWFVPGFGIIKIHLHEEHPNAIGDTTWTLIQHNNPNY